MPSLFPDPNLRIRALAADRLTLAVERIDRHLILHHIAHAPFSPRVQDALKWKLDGTDVIGLRRLDGSASVVSAATQLGSLEAHALKHVRDGCWKTGTSMSAYLADLHAAAGHPDAQLYVGVDPPTGRALAGTVTPLDAPGKCFRSACIDVGNAVFVIYDADMNHIRTGFTLRIDGAQDYVRRWRNHRLLDK